jgi:hypothetical protein
MATVKVVDVIEKTQIILQDTTAVRWPLLELQEWLNDSYREIVLMRPDANTQTGTHTCAAGARQVLTVGFPNAIRLIDVVRNVATTSDKRAVRLISQRALDDQRPTWYGETAAVTVQLYMFDPLLPREFLVYPPATTSAQLEVVYSSVPAGHSLTALQLADPANTTTINLPDSYANAVLDYILYRAYSKDSENQANTQRAVAHYQAMQASIGAKTASDQAAQPGAN